MNKQWKIYENSPEKKNEADLLMDQGSFFAKSLSWYEEKFLHCIFERIFVITCCILIFFLSFITISHVKIHKFSNDWFRIIRESEGDLEYVQIHKTIIKSDSEAQKSIIENMLKSYIEMIETHNRHTAKIYSKFVKEHSSYALYQRHSKAFQSYLQQLSREDRAKYATKAFVKSIALNKKDGIYVSAVVRLDLFINKARSVVKIEKTVAIDFSMSDIILVIKGLAPFRFKVTEYKEL